MLYGAGGSGKSALLSKTASQSLKVLKFSISIINLQFCNNSIYKKENHETYLIVNHSTFPYLLPPNVNLSPSSKQISSFLTGKERGGREGKTYLDLPFYA